MIAPSSAGLTGEFYAWLQQGELRFQACEACSRWVHPPRARCIHCGHRELSWRPSDGRGAMMSLIIARKAMEPTTHGDVPFGVAAVDLDDDLRVLARVVPGEGAATLEHPDGQVAPHAINDELIVLGFRPDQRAQPVVAESHA